MFRAVSHSPSNQRYRINEKTRYFSNFDLLFHPYLRRRTDEGTKASRVHDELLAVCRVQVKDLQQHSCAGGGIQYPQQQHELRDDSRQRQRGNDKPPDGLDSHGKKEPQGTAETQGGC